jgi:hypothetical protein
MFSKYFVYSLFPPNIFSIKKLKNRVNKVIIMVNVGIITMSMGPLLMIMYFEIPKKKSSFEFSPKSDNET